MLGECGRHHRILCLMKGERAEAYHGVCDLDNSRWAYIRMSLDCSCATQHIEHDKSTQTKLRAFPDRHDVPPPTYTTHKPIMPERSAFLDVVTIWSIIMRFSEPDDPAELLLALILIDFLLVIIAALQLRQTVVRGKIRLKILLHDQDDF